VVFRLYFLHQILSLDLIESVADVFQNSHSVFTLLCGDFATVFVSRLKNGILQVLPSQLGHKSGKLDGLAAVFSLTEFFEKLGDLLGLLVAVPALDDQQKLCKLNHARTVVVHLVHHVLHLVRVLCETQANQRIVQLLGADGSLVICVQ
jgi:hypothetical protein